MEQPLRFLLLPSATGGGHFRASKAVAAALEERGAEVTVKDVLKDYAPWPFSAVPGGYSGMLWGGGIIYGWIFRLLDHPWFLKPFHWLLWPFLRPAVRRLLAAHEVDLIVVSHPLPVCAVARGAREAGGPQVIGFTTDLVIGHSLNVSPDVDHYMVASDLVRKQLEARGVKSEIHEVGLPVAKQFAEISTVDRASLRRELGLEEGVPMVLLMTGGTGWGDVDNILRELLRLERAVQVVVVAGGNESLRNHIASTFEEERVLVKGFLEDIHRWMRAADLLVTKAGPNTIAEALVLGVPLILTSAIPSQETPNVEWIVEGGAGVWAPDARKCGEAILKLLDNQQAVAEMRANARRLARPDAAGNAAGLLLQIAESSAIRRESEQ